MSTHVVPAFLTKLWTLVEDPVCDEMISWDMTGESFHIYDQARFSREVLPRFFKHNNIASFVRQLNMYGFRKVVSVDSGSLKVEKDDMEFSHPYFVRDNEHLLENIKRKGPTRVEHSGLTNNPDISKVLADVRHLNQSQEDMNSTLVSMKSENETLWREVASLRNKHHKQQQILNKLIQFLVGIMQQSRSGIPNLKRRMPLMIDSSEANPKRQRLATGANSNASSKQPSRSGSATGYKVQSPPISPEMLDSMNGAGTAEGPTIQELTETQFVPDLSLLNAVVEQGAGQDNVLLDMLSTTNTASQAPTATTNDLAQVIAGSTVPVYDPRQQVMTSQPDATVIIPTMANRIKTEPGTTVTQAGQGNTKAAQKQFKPAQKTTTAARPKQQVTIADVKTVTAVPTVPTATSSAVALNQRPVFARSPSRPEMEGHVENMASEIDYLQDYLSGHLSVDPSIIGGLFDPEVPLTLQGDLMNIMDETSNAGAPPTTTPSTNATTTQPSTSGKQLDAGDLGDMMGFGQGYEVMTYNPANDDLSQIFDLEDLRPQTPPNSTPPHSTVLDTPIMTPRNPSMEEVD